MSRPPTASRSRITPRAGARAPSMTPIKDLAFYGQYSVAVDPVSNLITMTTANSNFQLATGKAGSRSASSSRSGAAAASGRLPATRSSRTICWRATRRTCRALISVQIGQQSSRGVEASVGFVLDHGWRIDANTALLRAKYDDFAQAVRRWHRELCRQRAGQRAAERLQHLGDLGICAELVGQCRRPDRRQDLCRRCQYAFDARL